MKGAVDLAAPFHLSSHGWMVRARRRGDRLPDAPGRALPVPALNRLPVIVVRQPREGGRPVPRVPEYTPDVQLRPAYRQGIDVQASPDAFGAAAGRGMQALGEGIANAGQALGHVAALQDETAARQARNDYIQESDALKYDADSGGYLTLQGKAAVDGYSKYTTDLDALRRKISSRLTPAQQNLFVSAVSSLETDARRSGLIHKANELKGYVVDEAQAGIATWRDQALKSYRDPALFAKYHAAGLHEIDGLAEKLGWPEARLKRAQEDFSSDLFSKTAMQIAADDPVAAAEFYVEHRGSMTPADSVATLKSLLPFLRDGLVTDAVNVDAGRPGPSRFAASSLPDEAYTLLGVISGVESPGYNVINGGGRVAGLARHPRTIGPGGISTAAGRYQFTAGTWDRVRAALKLPDFGPASQDIGAWWLAQQDYRARTGRDLSADIKAGNYAAVRHGLAGTWEGVAKLSDADFAARMNQAFKRNADGSASGAGSNAGMVFPVGGSMAGRSFADVPVSRGRAGLAELRRAASRREAPYRRRYSGKGRRPGGRRDGRRCRRARGAGTGLRQCHRRSLSRWHRASHGAPVLDRREARSACGAGSGSRCGRSLGQR
jgi:muramidase (phage lysozyme)